MSCAGLNKSVLFVALVACRPDVPHPVAPPANARSAPADVPVIDELAYYDALVARRPDVLSSDCYRALVLKPKYRERLLAGETFDAIRDATYTSEQRAFDTQWTRALQSAESAYCADHGDPGGCVAICKQACDACAPAVERAARDTVGFWPSGYPLCDFVGYQVGPRARPTGKILDWKVFFEIKDEALASFDAETYFRFTRALERAGFHGDSKIFMHVGGVRYQYNGIIIHSQSMDDARIAERVGTETLHDFIAARARGLDLATSKSPDGELDWHHYLCAQGKADIPSEGLAYVRERQ